MNSTRKSVKVKGYNRTHTFEIEKSTMAGHTFCYLKKNGNTLLTCTPKEFIKLKKLFSD